MGKDTEDPRDNAKGREQRFIALHRTKQREGNYMEEGRGKAPVYP